jgi:hypothetical protein
VCDLSDVVPKYNIPSLEYERIYEQLFDEMPAPGARIFVILSKAKDLALPARVAPTSTSSCVRVSVEMEAQL